MFNILPKEEKFFDLFNEAAKYIHRGGLAIIRVMAQGADIEKAAREVKEIEHQGDSIIPEINQKLRRTYEIQAIA